MSKLRVGVIGVGALGRHHARILSELEDAQLVGVAEPDRKRGLQVARSCGTSWVPDFRELLDQVDALTVVVPTSAHLDVASQCLQKGIPVLVEKPLASSAAEAETLVKLAETRNTPLQVGHVERFNPTTQVAWKLCDSPKYIRAERFSPYAFRSMDIGVVLDVMIHDLDLVLDLAAAEPSSVDAFGVSILGEQEDSVQARVTFESGCVADFFASRVHPAARRSMQIWMETGAVTVDFMEREVVHFRPTPALRFGPSPLQRARQPGADIEQLKKEVFGKLIEVHRPPVNAADALTAELSSFLDCVESGGRPLVDGQQALKAMRLAERILESVAQHQWDGRPDGAIGPFARVASPRRLAG